MKINIITNCQLPGGFVLHAETPAEELFLRQFGNVKDRKVVVSCGGNISEGRAWLTVTHLTPLAPDAGDSAASSGIVNASAESTSQTESAPTQRG